MKRLGREIWWMMAAVAFLGGGAWWFGSGGNLNALRVSNPLDPGPLRVEYTPLEKVELSAYDVWRGYDWAAGTRISQHGYWSVTKNWRATGGNLSSARQTRLVYRRAGVWNSVPRGVNERLVADVTRSSGENANTEMHMKVRLDKVPRDASEIRLRGWFERTEWYIGALPPNFQAPKNLLIAGPNRILTLKSKPFDIQIKGPNEPFPSPVVSRQTPLQFVDAKWIVEHGLNTFVLQVRRTDGKAWKSHWLAGDKIQITDEKSRTLNLDSRSAGLGSLSQEQFSPQRADTDVFVPFASPDAEHDESYEIKSEGPLRLRAQISDGECWPLSVDVLVPRVDMKRSDFGAPK